MRDAHARAGAGRAVSIRAGRVVSGHRKLSDLDGRFDFYDRFGMARVSTSLPSLVISTSSSMRIPRTSAKSGEALAIEPPLEPAHFQALASSAGI